ncbi:L,D-transpeptidase [Ferruginibacter yonginensis]|uniref:L,D-transpeptidase n=1 Tax=Ferruginibacter yonginensis TaxID=1310416 RepID=A0ABV8QSN6_9BACT
MYFLRTVFFVGIISLVACKQPTTQPQPTQPTAPAIKPNDSAIAKPVSITYTLLTNKDSIKATLKKLDTSSIAMLALVNRMDVRSLRNYDTLIMPTDLTQPRTAYFPFPTTVATLADVKKIIYFSYPAQAFAAYENGKLVLTGPTNMGKKSSKTPTGLFFTNWKAKKTISTVNDEWELKWNFNIANKLGVGFHEYALPGYPASHSCMRLKAADAQYFYYWADQWKVVDNAIVAYGTPVIVFGEYPFGQARPWLALVQNSDALKIDDAAIEKITAPYLNEILQKQQARDTLQ